jgi:hypothetical protein
MLHLSIFGVTAGTILGTHFRVLVLVPVLFFAAAIIVAVGFVNGFSVSTFLVALFVMQASLEFGYQSTALGRWSAPHVCSSSPPPACPPGRTATIARNSSSRSEA